MSDGSTDQTVEIASRYLEWIDLIVFEKNKGYGAAIKEAWRRSDAELLGFLDADGTCDPAFFVPLCNAVIQDGVDVALGCRLNQDSKMPMLRRVGNTLFATLLSALSSSRVRDTASGMRVVRRDALEHLYPLPNGLHFTPAMSARVMLSSELRLAELDMPYHEREGESKLRAGKDGLRFLKVILKTAVLFRPSRLLGLTAIPFFVFAVLLLALARGRLAERRRVALGRARRAGRGRRGAAHRGGACSSRPATSRRASSRWCFACPAVDGSTGCCKRSSAPAGSGSIPGVLTVAGIAAGLIGGLSEGGGRGLFSMVVLGAAAVLAGVTRLLDRFINVVAERLRYERNVAARASRPRMTNDTHDELFELGSSYDEMLEQGISLSGESKDYFIDGRIDHLRARLADGASSQVASVLDFACGVGDASSRLAAAFDGARVFGVDIAEGAVEEARRRVEDDRVEFGLLDAVPDDARFDLCYVNGAYHHIPPAQRLDGDEAHLRPAPSRRRHGAVREQSVEPSGPDGHAAHSLRS